MLSLFPVFSVVYINKKTDGTTSRTSTQGQLLRVIAIRKSSKTNCIDFYHPHPDKSSQVQFIAWTKHFSDGTVFSLKYDGGFFFNTYHNKAYTHRSNTFQLDSIVSAQIIASGTTYAPSKFIGAPFQDSDTYTLQHTDTQQIFTMPGYCLSPFNPTATPCDILRDRDNIIPSWIKPMHPPQYSPMI